MMREVGRSHFGQQGHSVWVCVPCKLEMHGTKEVDFHLKKEHGYVLSEWVGGKHINKIAELFDERKLEGKPNCFILMVDCRLSRKVRFDVINKVDPSGNKR